MTGLTLPAVISLRLWVNLMLVWRPGKSLSGMSVALNGENRLKDVANDKGASLASISTGKCGIIYAELEDHTEVQVVTGEEGCEGSNHYDVLPDDLGVGMTDPDGLKLYWRPWLSWRTVVRRLPMLELKLLELGRGVGTLRFWIWDMLW